VQCFFNCIAGGGQPILCGFQCLQSQQAGQLVFCVGTQCGQGICF
jgi:hypothetical protein